MARIARRIAGIGASDLPDAAAFDAYVGPAREITVDQRRGIIALHDGVTPGGQQFHAGGGGGDGDTAIDPIPKSFTGIAGTNQTYTLDLVPATAANVLVYVGGIRQAPGTDYTVSGATLTILDNPDGLEVDTLLLAGPYSLTFIQNGSVTEGKLANNAVTGEKLDDGSVTTAKIEDEAVTLVKVAPEVLDRENHTGANVPDDGSVSEDKVVADTADSLRITISNLAYPRRYGDYEPGGVVDCTAALNAAASSKKYVEIGEGLFKTTGVINIGSGVKIIGYGPTASEILIASTTASAFQFADGAVHAEISKLSIKRSGTPGANAHGVVSLGVVSMCKLAELYVQGHQDGMNLGGTGYSEIADIVVTNNLRNGIAMAKATGFNAIQWYISRILAQVNGNHGIYAEGLAGDGDAALGDWLDIRTFANSGAGAAINGYVGSAVNGLRLRGGFIGEDGIAGIYMNSRGFGHKIENMFLEIAGTRTTGPTLTTPATMNAPGLQINPNEQDVKVSDCYVYGNSGSGIVSNATVMLRVNDTTFRANTGVGVAVNDGAKYAETGCDFIGNTIAPRSFDANPGNALIVGSTPATTSPTQIPGGVAVGLPIGGTPTSGLINVAGGLLKNNTAYTNP